MLFSSVFCLNTSTNNTLMFIKENIQTHLDKNELTAGVFIDLGKAFDMADHDVLLTKLDYYEIRGWIMIGSADT